MRATTTTETPAAGALISSRAALALVPLRDPIGSSDIAVALVLVLPAVVCGFVGRRLHLEEP